MIRPGFLSLEDRRGLEACMRRHREDHGIARWANPLLLLDDGESCAQIAEFLYLDDDTIRGWHKAYQRDGWEALARDDWQGSQSRMTAAQEAELSAWLEGRFCQSTAPVRAHIAAAFGLQSLHSGAASGPNMLRGHANADTCGGQPASDVSYRCAHVRRRPPTGWGGDGLFDYAVAREHDLKNGWIRLDD